MIRAKWVIALAICLGVAAFADAQDGRLQQARDDTRSTSNSSNSSSDSNSNNDDSLLGAFLNGLFAAEDGDGNSLGGAVFGYALLAPFVLPAAAFGDDYKYHLFFAPHPYANAYRGYQVLSPEVASVMYPNEDHDVPRRHWGFRLSLEDGNDFRGLNRLNGQLRIDHESRFGLITNWNWYREKLSCGCTDETMIGDTNVIFRFAQNEVASMYTGLGFRVLSDRHQTDWGFNFTYGGDWFPVRPFIVSGVFDWGTLGNTGAVHARGSIGAIFRGWEVYAGYDWLQIGRTNLCGPMVGLRWWF